MVAELRREFNRRYTPQKYQHFLSLLNERCGTPVKFRNCETPCFLPLDLLQTMVRAGSELARQLIGERKYLDAARAQLPAEFQTPGETQHPLFLQADFGLILDENGRLSPRLVEMQGFPSLFAYQPVLADVYREAYDLPDGLRSGLAETAGKDGEALVREAILGSHPPEHVVLLEIDPLQQKTLPDFLLTEKKFGVRTVNVRDVERKGRTLTTNGRPIRRIYNRAIVDEMVRLGVDTHGIFSEELDVEWAGHPSWFYLISKFSLPFLRHATVPESHFLHELQRLPEDLDNFVLKPLYSFAGTGVKVGVTRSDIEALPEADRPNYILQRRMRFHPVIDTPFGMTQAEIRIMYIWLSEPIAVTTIIRMGRGRMMGVDHNRDLEWVGASAGFYSLND